MLHAEAIPSSKMGELENQYGESALDFENDWTPKAIWIVLSVGQMVDVELFFVVKTTWKSIF